MFTTKWNVQYPCKVRTNTTLRAQSCTVWTVICNYVYKFNTFTKAPCTISDCGSFKSWTKNVSVAVHPESIVRKMTCLKEDDVTMVLVYMQLIYHNLTQTLNYRVDFYKLPTHYWKTLLFLLQWSKIINLRWSIKLYSWHGPANYFIF